MMDIKGKIKSITYENGLQMTDIVNELKRRGYEKESLPNLSGRLSRGSISFKCLCDILDYLGQELVIREKRKRE